MHGSHLLVSAALIVAAALPLKAATSYDNYVDLQLVLAVDVSGSMDFYEQRVQRDGYVQAFRDPEVISAITSGPYGRIAVTYVHWAGAFFQQATCRGRSSRPRTMPMRLPRSSGSAVRFPARYFDFQRAPLRRERL